MQQMHTFIRQSNRFRDCLVELAPNLGVLASPSMLNMTWLGAGRSDAGAPAPALARRESCRRTMWAFLQHRKPSHLELDTSRTDWYTTLVLLLCVITMHAGLVGRKAFPT